MKPESEAKSLESLMTPQPDKRATCREHGPYIGKWLIGSSWSSCPECQKLRRAREELLEQQEMELRKAARMRSLMARSGIQSRFGSVSFDSFVTETAEQKRILEKVRSMADRICQSGDSVAIMSGRAGTGKTHLAISAVVHVINQTQQQATYVTQHELTQDVQFGWRDNVNERELANKYHFPKLLVIDEINDLLANPSVSRALFSVVDERYQRKVSTVLATNMSPKELADILDPRIYDRMREQNAIAIIFNGESYRGRARRDE